MRPKYHVFTSIFPASVVLILEGSIFAALIVFLAGVLPDLDHLLDFWIHLGIRKFELSDRYYKKAGKIYVFMHSYELLIGLLMIEAIIGSYFLALFLIGYITHLLTDIIGNYLNVGLSPKFYLFLYRYMKDFDHKTLCSFYYED